MRNKFLVFGLLTAGFVFACVFFVVFIETVGPKVSTGAQITSNGYASIFASLLGATGLTGAGIVTAIVGYFQGSPSGSSVTEIVELTASFSALIKDKSNRAAQRRFIFALVDGTSFIPGVTATHEGGVVVIRYAGYADPVNQGV